MPTRLYGLRRTDFQLLIENDRNIAFHLLDYTMDRLRRANQQIHDMTFLNVRSRIVKKLLALAQDYSSDELNEFVIPVKITHQQIAEMVGAARETVSKVLQELQDEGLIAIQGKRVHLQDIQLIKKKLNEEI